MSTLGIGVRVYAGWVPENMTVHCKHDPRLQLGIIIDGPFSSGAILPKAKYYSKSYVMWDVAFDNGQGAYCAEPYLFPVDDGQETTTEQHDKLQEVT